MRDEIIIKCDCIDRDTLSNLKVALLTSRERFEHYAKFAPDKKSESAFREKSIKIHKIFEKIKEVKPC